MTTAQLPRVREDDNERRRIVPPGSATVHLDAAKLSWHHSPCAKREMFMERRDFLKLAVGVAAGAAALAATAQAAPLMPHPLADDGQLPPSKPDAHPALTTRNEGGHLNT